MHVLCIFAKYSQRTEQNNQIAQLPDPIAVHSAHILLQQNDAVSIALETILRHPQLPLAPFHSPNPFSSHTSTHGLV